MELDLDHIERIAKQRQEAGGRVAARPEVILAMVGRIRALESASQPGGEAEPLRDAIMKAGIEYVRSFLMADEIPAFDSAMHAGDYSGCCDTPAYCSAARRCTAKDSRHG